jgi:GT2 family glycosyltransferase
MSQPFIPPDDADAPATVVPPAVPPAPTRRRRANRRRAWRRHQLNARPVEVSVCIANWNCRDLLRACLESLHDQAQGVALETIVVDNGSADGAADMVEREFPEVVLVRNPDNRGFSRANNQAAAKARGQYLFFLNNDTVVPAGTLGRLVEFLKANPDVGMVGPRLRDARGNVQVSYRQGPTLATLLHRTSLLRWTGLLRYAYRRYRRQDFDPNVTRSVDVLMGAAVLLPRDRFFDCGQWDEGFTFGGEDMDLSTRVNRRHRVMYYPLAEVLHYGRVSTRQHIGYASAQMTIGFARYLRKLGCSGLPLAFYKAVVTLDAPVQWVVKGTQYLWRRLQGRTEEAHKSLLALKGLQYFLLRELPAFWRA